MDRKRKLPPRGASRVEHVSKKRTMTPDKDSTRSASVTPAPAVEVPPPQDPPTPLPTSMQAGKPLPTLESPQPEDISSTDFQDYKETGVMAESLNRSRQKWIAEGLFEKYWTKPTKKKGVAQEDLKNPAKDSMFKLGQVTISIEPHVFEATMFGIKDPKSTQKGTSASLATQQPTQQSGAVTRPILQYGPPNGVMPPKPAQVPTPPTGHSVPVPTIASSLPSVVAPNVPHIPGGRPQNTQPSGPKTAQTPRPAAAAAPTQNVVSQQSATQNTNKTPITSSPAPHPAAPSPVPGAQAPAPPAQQPTPPQPAQKPGSKPSDPIIVMLAERASGDENLRDIMKKVAEGRAIPSELAHFQQVIDQITASQRKPSPPADRVIVDGRSVKYFADEVNVIIGVVLRSNPTQRAADLRPPNGSDPLVVALVKDALDKPHTTRAIINRIALGQPRFMDPQDLKTTLEDLLKKLPPPKPHPVLMGSIPVSPAAHSIQSLVPEQAPRSKLPSIAKPMPDISGVVFEFSGGTGDRYLFPKFSILDPIEGKPGGPQHVVASFLIVRKGSFSEYGGNPELDYYQPVTVRISSQSGRHLESLARAVAPEPEVRRYMDDVMDNMTRAEYVLLAMRLPRPVLASSSARASDRDRDDDVSTVVLDDSRTATPAPAPAVDAPTVRNKPSNGGVLWGVKAGGRTESTPRMGSAMTEEQERMDKYHKLINSAAAKDTEVV
ncbi:hypothetical protein BROUX41_000839 [Berkeleyomyces rouxiae]|uniref:uncharacterized protein n=1 Tax=Berkeleyomyces rouxiae TaxID=2035830 RepID=UPI003B80F557